jgi:hypothetical protein
VEKQLKVWKLKGLGMQGAEHSEDPGLDCSPGLQGKHIVSDVPFSDTLNVFLGQGVGDPAAFLQ